MAIILCDGNVYAISNWEGIERNQILNFFLSGHKDDILSLYDEKKQYYGIITYKSFLQSANFVDSIVRDKLFLEHCFGEEAQNFLEGHREIVVPVFDNKMEMLYLAKYEPKLYTVCLKLNDMISRIDAEIWKFVKNDKRHIHILGINDALFNLRKWLLSLGEIVSVEGEEWIYFGIDSTVCDDKDAIIVDEDCKWIELLYSKYYNLYLREEVSELIELLGEPYICDSVGQDQYLFYITIHSYFVDGILPLILKYLYNGKKCIIVFPSNAFEWIVYEGRENLRQMIGIIKHIKMAGGRCYRGTEPELYKGRYSVCFLCSEYSGELPLGLRKISQYVVALQASALYTHCYGIENRFEEIFSDNARGQIDYLITSEYMAEWICERNEKWDKKILRFGYPKLDNLYQISRNHMDIPENWKEKMAGKYVILCTWIEESWIKVVMQQENVVVLWRPHPGLLATVKGRGQVERIIGEYNNIILDNLLSYYAAFKISNAMIVHNVSSIMVNYLYMEKPVCFFDKNEKYHAKCQIDYRKEIWYECMYIAKDERDIFDFVSMVTEKKNWRDGDIASHRRQIVQNFDGKVCDRIYSYFDKQAYF